MSKLNEIIARLRSAKTEEQVSDAFDRLPRMVAAEYKRPVRLTPLHAR